MNLTVIDDYAKPFLGTALSFGVGASLYLHCFVPDAFSRQDKVYTDFEDFDSIEIQLPSARLQGRGQTSAEHDHKVTIHTDSNCEAQASVVHETLIIRPSDASLANLQNSEDCIYDISLDFRRSRDLDVLLSEQGNIELENWINDTQVKLSRGIVSFSRVGDFYVECQSCDISGEDVLGEFGYYLGFGTVGVRGLRSSVEGTSKGDVILSWSQLDSPNSDVSVHSDAGNIFLFLPKKAHYSFDLVAPRGESRLSSPSSSFGIPISAMSLNGNISVATKSQTPH